MRWRPEYCVCILFSLSYCLGLDEFSHPRRMFRAHQATSGNRAEGQQGSIPKLLHYIYLDGYAAFRKQGEKDASFELMQKYFDGCQRQHSHWTSMFWDLKMAEDLIKKDFGWFMPVWESYDSWEKKSDALRAMIMYSYGGLYLDFDVECFQSADGSLHQFDLMLQGSGHEGFNNGMLASAPGHQFWQSYLQVMKTRASGPSPDKSPKFMTGTVALTFAVAQNIPAPLNQVLPGNFGFLGGILEYKGSTVKIWPLGEWMQPCFAEDRLCAASFDSNVTKSTWDMTNVYGRHWFLQSRKRLLDDERAFDVQVN